MQLKPLIACIVMAASSAALTAADELPPAVPDQGITRRQADAILTELKAIREALTHFAPAPAAPVAAAPMPVKAVVDATGGETLGSNTALVTIVEFTDYQCPFCRQFHSTTFDQIRKKYVDSGKVRFVVLDYPLEFHSNAEKAAEAAHCAGDQGQFWRMRDVLSLNAAKLAPEDLTGYAQSLYMDVGVFRSCLDSGRYKELVEAGQKKGAAVGVGGTPSFVIGKTTTSGVDGVVFVGAQPLEAFEAAILSAGKN